MSHQPDHVGWSDADGQLGRGGFGVVKKGKWGKLTVAIKEMTEATDQKVCVYGARLQGVSYVVMLQMLLKEIKGR